MTFNAMKKIKTWNNSAFNLEDFSNIVVYFNMNKFEKFEIEVIIPIGII